ncbi:MAG: hypothetical protein J6X99_01445 [Bacteroidales bacterium]|nr:hypothetical protein [Bacteroidales bacterium]
MKEVSITSGANLMELYRNLAGDYPKFFKMDTLCKLGFLLTEMLVADDTDRFRQREDRAVLVFSREGSLADDCHYADSMADFPSPALFVYTLPNIISGEIAIRNKYAGETSAYVIDGFSRELIDGLVRQAFQDPVTESAVVVWADCPSDDKWDARGWLVKREDLA